MQFNDAFPYMKCGIPMRKGGTDTHIAIVNDEFRLLSDDGTNLPYEMKPSDYSSEWYMVEGEQAHIDSVDINFFMAVAMMMKGFVCSCSKGLFAIKDKTLCMLDANGYVPTQATMELYTDSWQVAGYPQKGQ